MDTACSGGAWSADSPHKGQWSRWCCAALDAGAVSPAATSLAPLAEQISSHAAEGPEVPAMAREIVGTHTNPKIARAATHDQRRER